MSKYEMDFSNAPEGATHYRIYDHFSNYCEWYKLDNALEGYYWAKGFEKWIERSYGSHNDGMIKIPETTEWDEEGLPPVGSKVWFSDCGSYEGIWPDGLNTKGCEVEIIAHHAASGFVDVAVFRFRSEASASEFYYVGQAIAKCFRPVLTDEQKAAKERDEVIKVMKDTICEYDHLHDIAVALYKAGYRLQEQE